MAQKQVKHSCHLAIAINYKLSNCITHLHLQSIICFCTLVAVMGMLEKIRHNERQIRKGCLSRSSENSLIHIVWQECMSSIIYQQGMQRLSTATHPRTHAHTNHSPGVEELKNLPLRTNICPRRNKRKFFSKSNTGKNNEWQVLHYLVKSGHLDNQDTNDRSQGVHYTQLVHCSYLLNETTLIIKQSCQSNTSQNECQIREV